MARLCLNMIVKNEASIIRRCLESLAPHIDCYVICDTGSTDDTVEVIQAFFASAGIPGEVVATSFLDFEQARNEALDAARASRQAFDYLLLCDADMDLVVADPTFRDRLDAPCYMVVQRTESGLEYPNIRIVQRAANARYRGVTHEYLDVPGAARDVIEGVEYFDHASGANRKGKYERDIALLKRGLEAEPDNARYVFYLANSYYDLGDSAEAMSWYEKRITMEGYQDEKFVSSYRIGSCLSRLGRVPEMIARLLETFEQFPARAEPLHAVAKHWQDKGRHRLAFHFAEIGRTVAMPAHGLFIETDVYAWRLEDITAVSLYWMGQRDEAEAINRRLLERVPQSQRARIQKNIEFCLNRN